MLRRPIQSGLHAVVGMDDAAGLRIATGNGHSQRVGDQCRGFRTNAPRSRCASLWDEPAGDRRPALSIPVRPFRTRSLGILRPVCPEIFRFQDPHRPSDTPAAPGNRRPRSRHETPTATDLVEGCSPERRQTACGSQASPSTAPTKASCTARSCSTPSLAGRSAGRSTPAEQESRADLADR
jgi:hypothetical protein